MKQQGDPWGPSKYPQQGYHQNYPPGQPRQSPQHDPRQQRPATPPQWGQGAPPRQDGTRGYAQPGGRQQSQPQFDPRPQYQPPQQPPPAPRAAPAKGNAAKGCAMLGCGGFAAVFILVAVIASHGSSGSPPAAQTQAAAAPASSAPAAPQTVTYVVTGSAADVTYGPAGSDYSGAVPMTVTKPLGTPAYYSINAQLQGGGTVSCEIKVDGNVISHATASGGYNIADCEISQDPLSGQWTDTNG